MMVHCHTCGTDFKLDETKIPSEGAWVRCGICGEVFQVFPPDQDAPPAQEEPAEAEQPSEEPEPPAEALAEAPGMGEDAPRQPAPEAGEPESGEAQSEAAFEAETLEMDPGEVRIEAEEAVEEQAPDWTPPQPDPTHGPPRLGALDLTQVKSADAGLARERADFGLEERPVEAERPPRGPLFKLVFWLIGIVLLAAITALGTVVVMARLGVGHEVVDQVAAWPGMSSLIGRGDGLPANAGSTMARVPRLSLVEVKSFLQDNETAGKIFVIQGKVANNHNRPLRSVLVQGTLRNATGKVVKRASSYAGSVFTPAELKFMSLGVIERRLASDLGLDGRPYVAAPGESLPFMIVAANLPKEGLQFTAEVIGSEPLAVKPVLR
ncbi:MAG: zinc-ribbon domain-containing protein [Desulfarculaceae bacterium]|nr:zinc-ribbon domain-containing protein [Desulfarculaceae bacterium]